MVLIMVSSASPVLQRLCSQQPNSTGLSPAMRRPCKDGTSYIVTGCDWYVRLHGNIHSKPKVPSWMPNEHYFSLGAGAQVWPISHSPFSWYVHLLMSCQMVGFLLMWQHAGSSVFAYMALRTPRVYGTRSGLELTHICCYDHPYPLGLWFICSRWDLRAERAAGSCPVPYSHFAKAAFLALLAREPCLLHLENILNTCSPSPNIVLYLVYDHIKHVDKLPGLEWPPYEDFRGAVESLVYIGIFVGKRVKNRKMDGTHSFLEEIHHIIALGHSPRSCLCSGARNSA